MNTHDQNKQRVIDKFHQENGPCCAGCDNWQWINSVVGECTKTAPVAEYERISMLELERCSINPGSGHILTQRDHVCGEFIDNSEKK